MPSPVTLRLSETTRKSVAAIARKKRITPSHAMREAIETWVRDHQNHQKPPSFYDGIADLIGVVHGDNPRLSEDTGQRFYELLKKKHNRP